MARLRTALLAFALGSAAAALLPAHHAEARWVGGVWVAPGYYPPPVVIAPPPVAYLPPPVYAPRPRPYWIPAHWDRWGRWHPAHWG